MNTVDGRMRKDGSFQKICVGVGIDPTGSLALNFSREVDLPLFLLLTPLLSSFLSYSSTFLPPISSSLSCIPHKMNTISLIHFQSVKLMLAKFELKMNQFFCLPFCRSKQIIQGLLAGYTDILLH